MGNALVYKMELPQNPPKEVIVMKKTQATPRKDNSTQQASLYMAFELSDTKWKLAFSSGNKVRYVTIEARHLKRLREEISKAKKRFGLGAGARMLSCY